MTEVESFVTNFHNLQGSTVADKKSNFFHLLHRNSSLHQNSILLDAIISQLNIKTHLERLFFVDLLIYFRRYKELCKEFLEGNDIVVSKISKERWFFEKILEENLAEFVDKFLPTLSYSLRLKILKRLIPILNEEQSDAIFDALHNRYGIFMASNILTSCSCDKIEGILRNHPIKLWTSQLKLLYNRQPELICVYLEERVKNEGSSEFLTDNPIVSFIAMKNPDIFCQLLEKYKLKHCKLGKRSTKHIVRAKRDNVIAKPELYATNLNPSRLVRHLGEDFEKIYFKMFPKNIDHVFNRWTNSAKLLDRYSEQRRFPLFKQTFDKVFNNPLETECVSLGNYNFNSMMEMVTDAQERETWARLKYENDKNDQYLKYFKPQNCLKSVVPKFNNFNPAETRAGYIEIITESCLINKDWQSLITVCELIYNRFKNESTVHLKFFQTLLYYKSGQVFNYLNENHWKYIKKILKSSQVKTRHIDGNNFSGAVMFKYLEFLCKRDTLTEKKMVGLMKKVDWVSSLKNFKSSSETEKRILLSIIKVVPQVIATIEKADIYLILACKSYKSRYNQEISIFENPRLIQSLKSAIQSKEFDDNQTLASVTEWVICSCNPTDEDLIKIYWDSFEDLATFNLTLWMLKYRPNLIMSNIEMFVSVVIGGKFLANNYMRLSTKPIWRLVKCYGHLQLDQTVLEYCLNKLNDEDFDDKISLAEPLSVIMESKDFIKLVESYKPTTMTVSSLDEEEKSKFQIQRYLLKSLVNTNHPQDVASVLLQFMSGDYVAPCISPLYSCLYKIPEKQVKLILDKLCVTGAVSVKKHGFYFICATQDETTILQTLESCRLSQSIAMAYQHFTKNPSTLSWDLVNGKLPKLDNNDHFTSLLLVNKPAPRIYKAVYFERTFDILRNKGNRFVNVLVDKLPEEIMGQLSNHFFITLKDDFLTMKKSDLILSYYLLYCPEVFKYDVIFGALRLFKEQQWSLRRNKLKEFVMTFCTVYMKWDKTDPSLLTTFIEGFVEIFPPVQAFEEFVILSLMQFKNLKVLDLSKSMIDLHNNTMSCYGRLVFEIFADCFSQVVDKFCPDEICKFQLFNSLLDDKKSVEDELLVVYLLPRKCPPLKDSALFYLKMVDLLRKSDNEVVQLHLRQHFDRGAENKSA